MKSLGLFKGGVLTEMLVLVLVQVVDVKVSIGIYSCKDGRRVGSPFDIANGTLEVKGNDGSLEVAVPHFDGPVSRARQEYSWMIFVPLNRVNRKEMPCISHQVLSSICL